MGRKDDLLRKLSARLDGMGRPKPGYAENVAAIRAELDMMEQRAAANPFGDNN